MVKSQILPNKVKNKDLIDAIINIRKELFIPKEYHDITYSDSDIHISNHRNLIRTFIMARMFENCNSTIRPWSYLEKYWNSTEFDQQSSNVKQAQPTVTNKHCPSISKNTPKLVSKKVIN